MTNAEEKPSSLIVRVLDAVCQADKYDSRLSPEFAREVLSLKSYTGLKIRHLLNNLCEPLETVFLEIGAWHGGTAAAAAFGNSGSFTTVDKFCDFGGDAAGTRGNFARAGVNVRLIEQDCWEIPMPQLPQEVNVFFYDGPHDYDSHKRALPHFIDAMAPLFVFLVDDWEDPLVRHATFKGVEELGLKILAYLWLGSERHEDLDGWWNALGVFILAKDSLNRAMERKWP